MTLTPQERIDIVEYRLDKAKHTFSEAKIVLSMGLWNLTANRLYYAAYYACAALLIWKGLEASTHKGVMRLIGLEFVKNGLLSAHDSNLIGTLFKMRQSGDYDDLFDWEEDDVVHLVPQVAEFINRIVNMIEGVDEK